MKKTIAIFCLSALIGASVQTASAGDREWATVGKVLTGVAAVHVLSHVLQPPPVYTTAVYAGPPPVYSIAPVAVVAPAPVVPAAPVYLQPPPVVVYPRPVYVTPAPVYLAPGYWPAPAVSLSFGFGYGHRPRYHCR